MSSSSRSSRQRERDLKSHPAGVSVEHKWAASKAALETFHNLVAGKATLMPLSWHTGFQTAKLLNQLRSNMGLHASIENKTQPGNLA